MNLLQRQTFGFGYRQAHFFQKLCPLLMERDARHPKRVCMRPVPHLMLLSRCLTKLLQQQQLCPLLMVWDARRSKRACVEALFHD